MAEPRAADGAEDPMQTAQRAFHSDDAALLRETLARHPKLKAFLSGPMAQSFDSPPITLVRSREMLDVLLEAGADINAKSKWWAGGFGLLHNAPPELARYAIERGAVVDIHAAARLGMLEKVRELLDQDPALVHARGGDGQMPLHFASTVEIAELLAARGADLNARDIDHESTAAQWMIKERQPIARRLVELGCATDLLMAAALGDRKLAEKHLAEDPECIRMRVSEEWFPMVGGKAGGTIYQWTLGWHVSAPLVAADFGHAELSRWLLEQSPKDVRLTALAWLNDETGVRALLAAEPELAKRLSPADQRLLAHAARNNQTNVVRMLLVAGLPVTARGQHNATPLHWAAWHGNAEMVEHLLAHNPSLTDSENDYKCTPLQWAEHGTSNGWHRDKGDYPRTKELLRAAAEKRGVKG